MRPEYAGQAGRRFVVTGGSGGLGLEICRALAVAGAEVVMAVRSTDKGLAAADRIASTGACGRVEVRWLDVSDLGSVRAFVGQLDGCDVLINNAGVMAPPFRRSVDGHELQLATNHLGHFALTNLVLPMLTDRVVTVGSNSHKQGELMLDDLDFERRGYQPYAAYCQSKAAQVSFIGELHRRLAVAGSQIRSVGGHPGYTATSIQSGTGSGFFTRLSAIGNSLVAMLPSQGALSILAAATLDVPSNTYLGPRGPGEFLGAPTTVGRSRTASDPRIGRALWTVSEELTGVRFPA